MTISVVDILHRAIRARPATTRPFVLGLCGSQGSGKSTAAAELSIRLAADGLAAVTVSLDDLYLTHSERERLADTHPLLATRGVPGTHDIALGERLLADLGRAGEVALPRFDKARDTRACIERWPIVAAPVDVVIFEGWCVGVVPQQEEALAVPVNALERDEDADGRWRRWVNRRCADYDELFARVDLLALLAAPDFSVVATWREEQECGLRTALAAVGRAGAMAPSAVQRFVQHYQRLTEHILREMPARADLVIRLAVDRRVIGVEPAALRTAA